MKSYHLRIFLPALVFLTCSVFAQQTDIPGPPPTDPVAQPRATPTTPTAAPINNGQNEKEDLLAYADLLYSQKQYALAAESYQRFLNAHPRSPNIQAGWFRLGECYLQVDQSDDAETTFNHIVATYKEGIFAGSAAFRLAVLRYNVKDYKSALPFFRIAVDQLDDANVKLRAQYYLARNYQQLNDDEAAAAQFQAILKVNPDPKTNPFYEQCLIETARLAADQEKNEEAYEQFLALTKTSTDPEIIAEGLARAGLLAATLGKTKESTELLDRLLKIEGDSDWKSYAKVGLIFNYFSNKEYEKVIGVYETGAYDGPDDQRAKMLLIVGHSYRLNKDLASAEDLYGLVEKNFRDSREGTEAAYSRLQILHINEDGALPVVAQSFVDRQREVDPTSSYIDQAALMKAEWHFARAQKAAATGNAEIAVKDYAAAAEAYKDIRDDKIDQKFIEPKLYKLGWSLIESGDEPNGAAALARFLQTFPKSPLASSALAKRGTMYQSKEIEDYASALGDFREIIVNYPEAKEVEFAMQQIALIHGYRRELPEMVQAYQALLEKFPETPGAPEAHYWIGVGLFDTDKFEEAIEPLNKARELDEARFGNKASLRIILAHYQLDAIEPLAAEATAYLKRIDDARGQEKDARPAEIPRQVLIHLGMKLFDKQDMKGAETFLAAGSTPQDPVETNAVVWKRLGDSRAQQGLHQGAIDSYEHYLAQIEKPSQRAPVFVSIGRAQYALGNFEEADASARESMSSLKEGRTNAEARMLDGDVKFAQEDYAGAARSYLVLSQIYVDKELAPLALYKASMAYKKAGDTAKSESIAAQLSGDFPNFTPPAG